MLCNLCTPSLVLTRSFHCSRTLSKVRAGRYRVTLDRSRPLTYEMALNPDKIGTEKSFNSFNTGQLEDTYGLAKSRQIGAAPLSHKLFMEDLFIRKFLKGTWSEMFLSEIIVKRQHNTVRVSGLIQKKIQTRKIYFLLGYTEEMLSLWLKCPVKLELQNKMNFEGQNISLKDALFVDNITGDIENFRVRSSSIARVLVFPPVNNYHRFLIHKVVETGFPQFTTFSVGEGLDRRTVVCFQQHLIDYTLKQAQEFVPVSREYQNDIIELKQTPADSNTIETQKNNLDPFTEQNANVKPPDDESTDNSQLVSENEPVVKLLQEKNKVSEVESDLTLNSEKNLFSSTEITSEPEPEIALKPEIAPKLEYSLEPEAALKPETDAPRPETDLEPELKVLNKDTSGMPIKAGNKLDPEDTKKPIPKEPDEGQSQSDVTNSTEMNNGSPKEDKGESLSEKKGCRSKRPAIAVYLPPRARNYTSSPGSAVLSVIKSSPTHPAVPVLAQIPSVKDDKGNTDVLDVTEQVVSEITVAVGGVQIEGPEVDYLTFQTSDSTINIDQFGHVIELYDFPSEYKTTDLVNAFEAFTSRWDIKWVDDTHALGVFSSSEVAAEALSVRHPTILTRPLNMATPQSKSKARSVLEELLPYKPRPVSCTATARRLLQGALGSAMRVPDASKLENERLLEARRRKDEVRRRVGDAPDERKKRRDVEIKPYVEKKHRYAEHDDR